MKSRWMQPALAGISALLFLVNLGGRDLWRPDEPRYAQVAREMLERGDYLTPHVNGAPYKEKPPLLFWMTAAFSAPFGDVTETTARLPLALSGIGVVLMTFALGARLFDRQRAFWAGIVLATSPGFWWHARTGQIDMLLTACVTASLLSLWLWHTHRRTIFLIGIYGGMAAGFLAKGPPALVFPLLTVLAFYWKRPAARAGLRLLPGMIAVTLVILAWYVPARMAAAAETADPARDLVLSEVLRQTIGRFAMGISHAKPPWHYVLTTPAYFLPWAVFLPWALVGLWKRRRDTDAMRFLWAWMVPAFVFFSISAGKRSLYLLPLYPAIALMLSATMLELSEAATARFRRLGGYGWAAVQCVAGFGAIAYGVLLAHDTQTRALVVFGAIAIAFALHAAWEARRESGRPIPGLMAGHLAGALLVVAQIVLPALNADRSVKDFCEPVRVLSEHKAAFQLISSEGMREEYIYYAHHPIDPLFMHASREAAWEEIPQLAEMIAALRGATESLPFPSVGVPDRENLSLLRAAVARPPVDGSVAPDAYAAALEQIRALLEREFENAGPTFLIAREREWRWILGVYPEAARLRVLRDETVDDHRRLLLANTSAAMLVASTQLPAIYGS